MFLNRLHVFFGTFDNGNWVQVHSLPFFMSEIAEMIKSSLVVTFSGISLDVSLLFAPDSKTVGFLFR